MDAWKVFFRGHFIYQHKLSYVIKGNIHGASSPVAEREARWSASAVGSPHPHISTASHSHPFATTCTSNTQQKKRILNILHQNIYIHIFLHAFFSRALSARQMQPILWLHVEQL